MQDGWCRWSQAGTLFICFRLLRHSFLRNTLKLKAMVETLEQFSSQTFLSAFYCFASHCTVSNWKRCSQWSKAYHSPVIPTPSCTSCCFGSPHYHWKWPFSGAKNWVFRRPNQKTDTTFCRQLYPKMVDETLVSYEYHYWVSFGQFLKIAYFRLIFGRFPLIKSQNQNPMARSVKYEVWNLEFFFELQIHKDNKC